MRASIQLDRPNERSAMPLTAQMPQSLPGLILLVIGHNRAVGTKRNDVLIAHVFHGPGPYPGQEPRFGLPVNRRGLVGNENHASARPKSSKARAF